jgi:hypothetical protein
MELIVRAEIPVYSAISEVASLVSYFIGLPMIRGPFPRDTGLLRGPCRLCHVCTCSLFPISNLKCSIIQHAEETPSIEAYGAAISVLMRHSVPDARIASESNSTI